MVKFQSVADIGSDSRQLQYVFGHDLNRINNLKLIDTNTLVYATASAVIFDNLVTPAKKFVLPRDENGVGFVSIHPSR